MTKVIKQGSVVCLNIKALYDKYGNNLRYTTIKHTTEHGEDYYDLYNKGRVLCTYDGEHCTVTHINTPAHTVHFENFEGRPFTLSQQEVSTAVFG